MFFIEMDTKTIMNVVTSYLIIDKSSPKSCNSMVIRIRREDERTRAPNLVNVLYDDQWLRDGFSTMHENWKFLMNKIWLEKKLALRANCLLKKLILGRIDVQGNQNLVTNGLVNASWTFKSLISLFTRSLSSLTLKIESFKPRKM